MFSNMRYVYEVYKQKSFSKAARKLFISQPSLSAMIKKTEEKLGITIFDRSSYPVKLTDEGAVYIEAVEKIMDIENQTKQYFEENDDVVRGKLKIGGPNSLFISYVPKLTAAFLKKYPYVEIQFYELPSAELSGKTEDEQLDLFIDVGKYNKSLFEADELFVQKIFIAVPENQVVFEENEYEKVKYNGIALRKIEPQKLKKFHDADMLILTENNDINQRGYNLFHQYGTEPKVKMYFDQMATSYHFAKEGIGSCFVTDTLISTDAEKEKMTFYEINTSLMERSVFIGRKRRKNLSRAAEAFINFAKDFSAQKIKLKNK